MNESLIRWDDCSNVLLAPLGSESFTYPAVSVLPSDNLVKVKLVVGTGWSHSNLHIRNSHWAFLSKPAFLPQQWKLAKCA